MQQEEFLKKNVFNDLENLKKEPDQANFYIFSEQILKLYLKNQSILELEFIK